MDFEVPFAKIRENVYERNEKLLLAMNGLENEMMNFGIWNLLQLKSLIPPQLLVERTLNAVCERYGNASRRQYFEQSQVGDIRNVFKNVAELYPLMNERVELLDKYHILHFFHWYNSQAKILTSVSETECN